MQKKSWKKLSGVLLCVIALSTAAYFGIRYCVQQAKLEKDACDAFEFQYQSIERPERISFDKLETMFDQHRQHASSMRNREQSISDILGIHHPLFSDPWQQDFFYRLSEAECKRSEQLLRDMIRHSNKIIRIRQPNGKPEGTLLPTKETRETLANVFSFPDKKMYIPPRSVILDYQIPDILLFPSDVGFYFFDRERCFISTRGSSQRLEGTVSREFIDACFALRQDDVK